jgi:hypothetical protein
MRQTFAARRRDARDRMSFKTHLCQPARIPFHGEPRHEDDKGKIELDHYESRLYLGLKRYLILSAISYLFLAQARRQLGGEKPGADRASSAHGHHRLDSLLVARAASFEEATRQNCYQASVDTAKECASLTFAGRN